MEIKKTGLWFGRQAVRMCLMVLLVSILAFGLLAVSPIDPLQTNVGQTALGSMSPEQIAKLKSYWGTDLPPVERYLNWLKDFLHGNMGTSLLYRRPVAEKPDFIDELYTMDQLDEVLPKVDFAVFILPSTPATHHIMDERRLRLMKPGSYLINAGRGDAVDCDALNKVLREGGALAGCALDVTEPEPLPADHPLWDAPRTIITPHSAGKFHLQETFERIVRITGENLKKYLDGEKDKMRNQVDVKTGNRK